MRRMDYRNKRKDIEQNLPRPNRASDFRSSVLSYFLSNSSCPWEGEEHSQGHQLFAHHGRPYFSRPNHLHSQVSHLHKIHIAKAPAVLSDVCVYVKHDRWLFGEFGYPYLFPFWTRTWPRKVQC